MKIKEKYDINELYFGYVNYLHSWPNELTEYNLFDSMRVKHAVAMYILMDEAQRKQKVSEPLIWCFGDTLGRCEYEFIINRWPSKDDNKVNEGTKVDIWTMYVVPNRELLLGMVSKVSKASAKRYLKAERKYYGR